MTTNELDGAVPETSSDDISIRGRALLVCVTVSAWSARRFDKKISKEVADNHGASAEAGRYNKHLFANSAGSHTRAVKLSKKVRDIHYGQTLAWSDEGWRLLPSANFMDYTDAIRGITTEFEDAVEKFIGEYEELVAKAQEDLGDLWNAADYPSTHEIRRKFRIDISYRPVPEAGDFRLDLPAEHAEIIARKVEEEVRSATDEAMRDAWKRLYEIVQRIFERLSAEKVQVDVLEGRARGSIRDSLIESARDTTDLLTRLNVTGDPALEEMRKRVVEDLTEFDSYVLRDDRSVRDETAKKAASILDAMNEVFGDLEG